MQPLHQRSNRTSTKETDGGQLSALAPARRERPRRRAAEERDVKGGTNVTCSPKSSFSAAAMRRKDSLTFVLHPKQLMAFRSKAAEGLYGGANRGSRPKPNGRKLR